MLLCCEEVMRKPLVTVTERDDVGLATALLQHHGFRHLPVVRGNTLVGLVTQRDLLRAGLRFAPTSTVPIADVMVKPVKTVRPGTPVRHAARVMLANHISCLPVTDETGALVGIITESDLVALAAELAEEFDREDAEICRGV